LYHAPSGYLSGIPETNDGRRNNIVSSDIKR
jgi:hypothetical protein